MKIQPPAGLSLTREITTLPAAPFIYLEKKGPFIINAPLAWREFWQIAGAVFKPEEITGMIGLGRIDASKQGDDAFIYQAGITVKQQPENLPTGLRFRIIPEAKYARFLLTGAYSQLASAYPAIFAIMDKEKLSVRQDDFCTERYLNDPKITPEAELKTEILIPIM